MPGTEIGLPTTDDVAALAGYSRGASAPTGPGTRHIYMSADSGKVWRRDESMATSEDWVEMYTGTGNPLGAVWAEGTDDVYAAIRGNNAMLVRHWNGSSWGPVTLPSEFVPTSGQVPYLQGLDDGTIVLIVRNVSGGTGRMAYGTKAAGFSLLYDWQAGDRIWFDTQWHVKATDDILAVGNWMIAGRPGVARWNGSAWSVDDAGLGEMSCRGVVWDGTDYWWLENVNPAKVYKGSFGSWSLQRTLSSGSGLTRSYRWDTSCDPYPGQGYDPIENKVIWPLYDGSGWYLVYYDLGTSSWGETSTNMASTIRGFSAYGNWAANATAQKWTQDGGATWNYRAQVMGNEYCSHIIGVH